MSGLARQPVVVGGPWFEELEPWPDLRRRARD